MKKRARVPSKKSKKLFTNTADSTHKFNLQTQNPMRGGIRM